MNHFYMEGEPSGYNEQCATSEEKKRLIEQYGVEELNNRWAELALMIYEYREACTDL